MIILTANVLTFIIVVYITSIQTLHSSITVTV